jgi:hypothetical protein
MSVSANYSTGGRKFTKNTLKCQKCGKNPPTSKTSGDFCTQCFLQTSNKRFVATLGKAGVRKFESIIVPFEGDIPSFVMFDHLKHHHCFAMPFGNEEHYGTNFSGNNNDNNNNNNNNENLGSFVATALDISIKPKEKKDNKGKKEQSVENSENNQNINSSDLSEQVPEALIDPITTNDNTIFPYKAIVEKLNQIPIDNSILQSPSFPYNIDPTPYIEKIPTISTDSEIYHHATSKLCDSTKFCSDGQAHLNYRCSFIQAEGTFINTLLATNGSTPFKSLVNDTNTINTVKIRLGVTDTNYLSDFPRSYPAVRLVDVVEKVMAGEPRVLPYMYIKDAQNAGKSICIGSQLLSNITTLPVLSIPIECMVPDGLVKDIDVENAKNAIDKLFKSNPALSTKIDTTYYTTMISKSYTLYRLFTSKALPNPTVWQKSNHSFFSSVCDFVNILKTQLYTKMAILTFSRAILATPTVDDISTRIITGLTKGAADTWLPRLVQWSPPVVPNMFQIDADDKNDEKRHKIFGNFVDTNKITDFSYNAKKTIFHNELHLPLYIQIPIINIFYENSTKSLFFHWFFSTKLFNLSKKTSLPQLFWFPSEYLLNNITLTSSTKNADRVSASFTRLLISMNESSASNNVVKTADKLIPHREVQKLHVKFTEKNKQIENFNQNCSNFTTPSSHPQPQTKPQDTRTRTTPPDNVAAFFIQDGDDDAEQFTQKDNIGSSATSVTAALPKPPKQRPNKPGVPPSQTVTAQQRPAAPILHFNNSSDGWFGDRCVLCGSICPDPLTVPQPPIRVKDGTTQHLANHPGYCSPCTLIIQDCDPDFDWVGQFGM